MLPARNVTSYNASLLQTDISLCVRPKIHSYALGSWLQVDNMPTSTSCITAVSLV